jgi:hypothetical protein
VHKRLDLLVCTSLVVCAHKEIELVFDTRMVLHSVVLCYFHCYKLGGMTQLGVERVTSGISV